MTQTAATASAKDSAETLQSAPAPERAGAAKSNAVVHNIGGPKSGTKQPIIANIPAPVRRSRISLRHWIVVVSFLALVVFPCALASAYLWTRAADQFVSRVGFSIRHSGQNPSANMGPLAGLAGLSGIGGTTADDADILNEYLRSHEIVKQLDLDLDLKSIWSQPTHSVDPIFSFGVDDSIEALHGYWQRMVDVQYDGGAGMLAVEVSAFTASDANLIATAIFEAASEKINGLNDAAREDAIRFSRLDLGEAENQLADARANLTQYRNRTQIVDPNASLKGQMGLLENLQTQLANVYIQHDLLAETTNVDDPRLKRLSREILAIEQRVKIELAKLGLGPGDGSTAYASLYGDFERLLAEREFSEEAYVLARAAFESARTEARRKSRYLVAHVPPTLAERPEHPQRIRLVVLLGVFLFLGWTLMVLTGYSLKDRK